MSTLRVNNILDSSGGDLVNSRGIAKAWVNFNGTGTVAIRASMNVTSITDNGTGDYTVNFTNALADANYTAAAVQGGGNTAGFDMYAPWSQAPTATTYRLATWLGNSGSAQDCPYVQITFFR